jgi:hypothetical protein
MTAKYTILQDVIGELELRNVTVRAEVRCGELVADLVTPTAVYAITTAITLETLQRAVDHATACRDALDPRLKIVVVGVRGTDDLRAEVEAFRAAGIIVNYFGENARGN